MKKLFALFVTVFVLALPSVPYARDCPQGMVFTKAAWLPIADCIVPENQKRQLDISQGISNTGTTLGLYNLPNGDVWPNSNQLTYASNLLVWLDAMDPNGNSIQPVPPGTSKTPIITSWFDKSGNGNNVVLSYSSSSATRIRTVGAVNNIFGYATGSQASWAPTYIQSNVNNAITGTSGLNSLPGIQFSSSNLQYFLTNNIVSLSTTNKVTIFIVSMSTSPSLTLTPALLSSPASPTQKLTVAAPYNSTGALSFDAGAGVANGGLGNTLPTGASSVTLSHIWTFVADGSVGGMSVYDNCPNPAATTTSGTPIALLSSSGTLLTGAAATGKTISLPSNILYAGANNTSGSTLNYANSMIGEIIIYNAALVSTTTATNDYMKVCHYLKHKWHIYP